MEKDALRRHCQCCGRAILANTGVIAHHGFKRPEGWAQQIGTCMGSRELPFEADRAVLGRLIVRIIRDLHDTTTRRDSMQAEIIPAPFRYRRRHDDHRVDVTRATFDIVREAYADELRTYSMYSFDKILGRELGHLNRTIEMIQRALTDQKARFDGWKQTERWDGSAWQPVDSVSNA